MAVQSVVVNRVFSFWKEVSRPLAARLSRQILTEGTLCSLPESVCFLLSVFTPESFLLAAVARFLLFTL